MQTINQLGGVNIGEGFAASYYCACWPFANLTATTAGISIEVLWKRYYFDKANVSSILRYNWILPFFTRGIEIIHKKKEYPPFVVFWSFSREQLLTELGKLGYPVDEKYGKKTG